MRKYLICILLFGLMAVMGNQGAFAAVYSTVGAGSSTIGTSGDYPTLAQAVAAASGTAKNTTVTEKSLTTNVARMTLTANTFVVGDEITVDIGDPVFDGVANVTVSAGLQVSWARTNANVVSTPVVGADKIAYQVTGTGTRDASDWTFYILNDLTERTQSELRCTVNAAGHVIFKPAAGVKPIITWPSTIKAAAPSTSTGKFVIGARISGVPTPASAAFTSTNNIVFDGSNTVSGTTRDMVFQNESGDTEGSIGMFRIRGNCDGIVFKNLIVNDANYASTAGPMAIQFSAHADTPDVNKCPDDWKVDNCLITVNNGVYGAAVACDGTVVAGQACNNFQITNNVLMGGTRTIRLFLAASGLIRGNTLHLEVHGGYNGGGVFLLDMNSATGVNLTFDRNIIDTNMCGNTSAGEYSVKGLLLSPGNATGSINITNNIFSGWAYGNTATVPAINQYYNAINVGGGNPSMTINIEHNSINMPDTPYVTGQSVGRVYAIGRTATANVPVMNIKNNIIRFLHTGLASYAYYFAAPGSLTITNNDVWAAGAKVGYIMDASGTPFTVSNKVMTTNVATLTVTPDPTALAGHFVNVVLPQETITNKQLTTATVTNKVKAINAATLTFAANPFSNGDVVNVALSPADINFDGTGAIITFVTATTITYTKNGADVVPAASAGTVNAATITLSVPTAFAVNEQVIIALPQETVTTKTLSTNVATLWLSGTHKIAVNESVVVAGVDATFNGTFTVTGVTASTISYAKTAGDVAPTASGGTVDSATFKGTVTITGLPTTSSFTYNKVQANVASTATGGTVDDYTFSGNSLLTSVTTSTIVYPGWSGPNIATTPTGGTVKGGSVNSSFAAWQSAGFDLGGQNVDPTATTGGVWACANVFSGNDLHFTGAPGGLSGTGLATALSTDVDGAARATDGSALPGADVVGTLTNGPYSWSGGTGDFAVASNWTPTRTTPLFGDVLVFDGVTATVSNVQDQHIGGLKLINGANITLSGPGAISTLFIWNKDGSAADDFAVGPGSTLKLTGPGGIYITLNGDATGLVEGDVIMQSTVNGTGHQMYSRKTGGLVFASGSSFAAAPEASAAGSPFGYSAAMTKANNTTAVGVAGVVFKSGSTYYSCGLKDGTRSSQYPSNPFALTANILPQLNTLVDFESGSDFVCWDGTPAASGRLYGNFIWRGSGAASISGANGSTIAGNFTAKSSGLGKVAVTNKVKTTNVATLTFTGSYTFATGNTIAVNIGDPAFDTCNVALTAATANTVSYTLNGADVGTQLASGYLARSGKFTFAMTSATKILGNFVVQTSASDPGTWVSMNGSTPPSITIGGNVDIQDPLYFTPCAAREVIFNGAAPQNINFAGKTLAGAVLSGAGKVMNLTGALGMAGAMTVPSGYTLNCGANQITGAGTFTLASGTTLEMKDAGGIAASGASGQIQTTNRSFSQGVIYIYDGSVGQVTGTGLPAVILRLQVDNPTSLSLTNSELVSALDLTQGELVPGAKTLAVANDGASVVRTSGFVRGSLTRSIDTANAGARLFPIGTIGEYAPVTYDVLTTATGSGNIAAETFDVKLPAVPDGAKAIDRIWTLTPSFTPTAGATLVFGYQDADVPLTAVEADLKAVRDTGGGLVSYNPETTINISANTATVTGVTALSPWSLINTTPDVALSAPLGDDWGYVLVGQPGPAKALRVTNIGLGIANVTSVDAVGDAGITFVDPGTFALDQGEYQDIVVNFTPGSVGAKSKTITVHSNAPDAGKAFLGAGSNVIATNPVDFGFAKIVSAGGTGKASILEIDNMGAIATTYTLSLAMTDEFSTTTASIVFVDAFSSATIGLHYLPQHVDDDSVAYHLASSALGAPDLDGSLIGRGWSAIEGNKMLVVGAAGATVQVGAAGSYTLSKLVIPAGAFTGSDVIVTIQEPTNQQGKPNAVQVKFSAPTSMGTLATLYIEYKPADEDPPASFLAVAKWVASAWSIIGTGTLDNPSGGTKTVGISSFITSDLFATKNTKTEVRDWMLIK